MSREEKARRLLRALSDADETYIEEAIRFRESRERGKTKAGRSIRFSARMRMMIAAAACLLLVFAGYYGVKRQAAGPQDEKLAGGTPYIEVDNLEEAEKQAGFNMQAPDRISGFEQTGIAVYDGDIIEISYGSENQEKECIIRKARGSEDISGDYNAYQEITTENINGQAVTFKGCDGRVSLAVWNAEEYSYAVSIAGEAVTADVMTGIVEEVQ